jgi:Tol biopolymer transport system component
MQALPLWVVEGQAEYLSLGRDDPHTAMWMRDAVLQNKLPTIKQLTTDTRFFPYRYGEALWAYVGGRWGDRAVVEVYKAASKLGFERGIQKALGISADQLSKDWIASTRAAYEPVIAGRTRPSESGTALLPVKRIGDMSLSPEISPDGRYVAFFAARDIFGYDLYLADASTGRSVKKLADVATSTEFDALSFISSAGTWSPDGKKFAFIVYAKGNQEVAILDAASRSVEQRVSIPGIGSIQHPSWSPDGSRIAFSGTVGGISDLFVYDLGTRTTTRLTDDKYADIEPSWSPDGRTLVFSTDRGGQTDFTRLQYAPLRLALIDVASRNITPLRGFDQGKHINPQFSPDGNSVYFISDRSGVSDIYRLNIASGAISQVTNVATGVSGITNLAPAFSVSRADGRIAFSVFEKQGYGIYSLTGQDVQGREVQPAQYSLAGLLPPADAFTSSIIARYLADPATGLVSAESFRVEPYHASLALAALGRPSIGVGTSSIGPLVNGGTSLYFTDILGNRNLALAVNANGTFKDIGGEAVYANIGHRFVWGLDAAHTPYASAFTSVRPTTFNVGGQRVAADLIEQFIQRIYEDRASLITQYPFSVTRRAELSLGFTRLGFNTQVEQIVAIGNEVVADNVFDTTSAPSISFARAAAALVGDNSFFGFTSPIAGWRYRAEYAPTFGGLQFQTALLDARRYFFARPLTFAVRALHFGRYGRDAESDRISPVFAGDPSIIRGYSAESFDPAECTVTPANPNACPEFDRLVGSRLVAGSLELRIPLAGNERFGLIRSPFLPIEIAPFLDGAVTWTSTTSPSFTFARTSTERIPVFSTGVSARANLLGYAVLEVFYAHPFQRPAKSWVLGFQLAPGW